MQPQEITEEDFKDYEEVRLGGRTNMFHLTNVAALSGLSRERIICIMENYTELKEQYIKKEATHS